MFSQLLVYLFSKSNYFLRNFSKQRASFNKSSRQIGVYPKDNQSQSSTSMQKGRLSLLMNTNNSRRGKHEYNLWVTYNLRRFYSEPVTTTLLFGVLKSSVKEPLFNMKNNIFLALFFFSALIFQARGRTMAVKNGK